jgi:anti-sigma factor RsiW
VKSHQAFEELAAGHALNALEPGDEQTFLAHLDACSQCQQSLAEFSEVAAGLAVSSADEPREEPPRELWESIRQQVEAEGGTFVSQAKRRNSRTRVWLSAAAAAVVVAAGVVGWQVARDTSSSGGSVQSALEDCRQTTACQVVPLTSDAGKAASAYVLVTGQDVRVATKSLPAIDGDRQTYVLWQMPKAGRPVGVVAFGLPANHDATVAHGMLTQPYDATAAFAISLEQGTTIPAKPSPPVAIGAAPST